MARYSEASSGIPANWQSETLITVGATEALASAFMGLLNRGDEVGCTSGAVCKSKDKDKFETSLGSDPRCNSKKEHLPDKFSNKGRWKWLQVILFDPQYDAYIPLCIANGGVPKVVKLDPSDWSVPHDQLAEAFTEKTKFILVNSPHNPTGKVFSREDLQFIADLCTKWGTYAVLDEVRHCSCFLGSAWKCTPHVKGAI